MSQAVGQGVENIFLKIEKVEQGDTFLLSSEGLFGMVSDNEIRDVLLHNPAMEDQCRRLVARALENGGQDSVTVMAVQV